MSLCRNGHDLAIHGEMHETPSRKLHRRCRACLKAARARRDAVAKQRRAAKKPVANQCKRGHPRAEFGRRAVGSKGPYWRCLACDRVWSRESRKRRRKRRDGA